MTQSDMILEFIDGTLDSDMEQGLFDSLALQPELRATLRQFITIGDAVRSDREAFIPPAYIERSLLGGLGLAGAATEIITATSGAGAGAAAAGGWLTRMIGAKGLVSMAASFVAGAILAAGGLFLTIDKNDSSADRSGNGAGNGVGNGAGQVRREAVPTAPLPGAAGQDAAPAAAAPASVAPRRIDVIPPGHTTSSSLILSGSEGSALSGTSGSSTEDEISAPSQQVEEVLADTVVDADTPAEIIEIAQTNLREAIVIPPSEPLAASRSAMAVSPSSLMIDEQDETTFKFEIRKHASWSLQQNRARTAPISGVQKFFTEDIAVGSYYRLDENLALGAEVGFDRYTQTLDVALGETLRVEQQPKFFWGGVALRYTGDRMFDLFDLRPFLQATGGATAVGPLLRTRLGTQYSIGLLRWNLAAEASSMVYRTNGQRQLTGRFGVTLGVELGL